MGKKTLMVLVVLGLLLSSCAGKNNTSTTPSSSTTTSTYTSTSTSSSSSSQDLSCALNLVLGSTSTPSVFSSYHIDINLDVPQLSDDSSSVVNKATVISADVQGANVHIIQTDPGATASKEGYIIGDKEYKIIDGKPEEMRGQIALGWAMWPLQVIMPYAYAAYFGKQTGTETLDGRNALVYKFDSANTDSASSSVMDSFGLSGMTTGKGTVWIDQETGGMIKLAMTYSEELKDSDQKTIGPGTGNLSLEVTKVNQVEVVYPY